MTTKTNQSQITRPTLAKTVNAFYVSFYGMDENIGNILGREVMSIERPNLNFNVAQVPSKGKLNYQYQTIEYQPISCVLRDDAGGLVAKAIYQQIIKQTEQLDQSRFNIGVKIYDAVDSNTVIESFTLKRCFIQNISHSEGIYEASTDNQMTLTIQYEVMDYDL